MVLPALLAGCLIRSRKIEVGELERPPSVIPVAVKTPLKAHLLDGSVVIFPDGAMVSRDSVVGAGERFDLQLASQGRAGVILMDSVAGLETYRVGTHTGQSVLLSVPATLAALAGGVTLFKLLFGSCPTFYTDSAGSRRLEAEGFSYSIAPLFEGRDVDALRGTAAGRWYQLEVLNEALETHYLNHVELLVVDHDAEQRVLPDHRGQPLAIRRPQPAREVYDASGRNVARSVSRVDDSHFSSDPERLARVTTTTIQDRLDLEFAAIGADSAALVLHLRNSLLSTILLYDLMLGDAGARSLDWVGQGLEQIGTAAELAKWYGSRMGLRVDVLDGAVWRTIARVPDTGPIAWKDLAIMIPTPRDGRARVRLTFPTDGWRIDHIALAEVQRVSAQSISAAQVRRRDGAADVEARAALRVPDQDYLITEPGQRVTLRFDLPAPQPGRARSYLLASQGYYIEWVRPDWVRRSTQQEFRPGDDALLDAMRRWHARRKTFEQQFYSTAIPVH